MLNEIETSHQTNRTNWTSPLVGIARLAHESPKARAARYSGVEYFALASRSALNRESSGRMPFAWTLNPYRGCEFGCTYCYARYTHEFMELNGGDDFERKIYAKVSAPDLLRRELAQARDRGQPIALGTATDPYQPAEKHFGVTRQLLEVFSQFEGLELSITTKGPLILRDLELLQKIARRNRLTAYITVTTTNARLARCLEPKAPTPAKRLEAVASLVRAGLRAGVNAAPILPGITDAPSDLESLVRAAAACDAQFIFANVVFLMPSAMARFMPFLETEFPSLVRRYRSLFARSAYLPEDYKQKISARMAELRSRYGFEGRREEPNLELRYRQFALPFAQ